MSSELINRPSTSKMQARTGGKVAFLVWISDMADARSYSAQSTGMIMVLDGGTLSGRFGTYL